MYKYYVTIAVMLSIFFTPSLSQHTYKGNKHNAAAPSLAADNNKVYMVYALGDTILFCSSDNNGKDFSAPMQAIVLSQLSTGGGRGPQIAVTNDKMIIAGVDKVGNIYSFIRNKNEIQWKKGGRINDVPGVAKEGFVSLASNENGEVYAVWLDLRNNNKNKIAGAKSSDGGKTWSKNRIIYTSPGGTVCECCKPSVQMRNKVIAVMFRNWLNGNRDLFITKSEDGGQSFDKAKQLGEGNWKLNACPMDGGGLIINNDNTITTVWRREADIYLCEVGKGEKKITVGKQCTIAGNNNNTFITYINNGRVYCMKPDRSIVELGTGIYPQLIQTGQETVVCAWQQERQVGYAMLNK